MILGQMSICRTMVNIQHPIHSFKLYVVLLASLKCVHARISDCKMYMIYQG